MWSTEGVVCEPTTCDAPTAPNHAVINTDAASPAIYNSQEIVTYSCKDDHVMLPASSTGTRITTGVMTCDDGNWSIVEPDIQCIACNAPPDVPHATWVLTAESPAQAVYSCKPGYNFTTDSRDTLTCIESTEAWSEDVLVRCEPVDCGEPPSPGNGTFSTTGTKYRDTATYTCNDGFENVGGDIER